MLWEQEQFAAALVLAVLGAAYLYLRLLEAVSGRARDDARFWQRPSLAERVRALDEAHSLGRLTDADYLASRARLTGVPTSRRR